eukprot:s62_g12.t1
MSFGSVLSACSKRAMWRHSLALFEEALAQSLRRNVILYSALIHAYENSSRWEAALQCLAELKICSALTACEARKQWPHVVALLQEAPSRESWNRSLEDLLLIWIKRGGWSKITAQMHSVLSQESVLALCHFLCQAGSGHGSSGEADTFHMAGEILVALAGSQDRA